MDVRSGEVGLGTIVRDSYGKTMMVMEKFQPFIGFVLLVEDLALHEPFLRSWKLAFIF